MDDFCKTAWHLIELVEKSSSSTREMRKSASRLRSDADFSICEYAANTEKHGHAGIRVSQKAKHPVAKIRRGWGVGRYGVEGFGVGEQSIEIVTQDSNRRDAFEFVNAVLEKWEAVFE